MIAILARRVIKHLNVPEWAYASDLRWITAALFLIAAVVNFMVWRSAVHDLKRAQLRGRDGPKLAARMLSGDEFLRMIVSLGLFVVSSLFVYYAVPVPGLAVVQTIILSALAILMTYKSIRMWVLRERLKDLPSTGEWTGAPRRRTDPTDVAET